MEKKDENTTPSPRVTGRALHILQEGINGAEADMQSDGDAGERVDLFDYEISLPYETAREIATLLRAPAPQNHVTAEEQRLRKIVLDLQNERLVMIEALKPFAACADEIDHDDKERDEPTSDDEWAKFRLLASDYRRARAALNVPTYNASPSSKMTGWQDISTAPKNTKVLAAYRNENGKWRIVTACYHTELPWSDEYGDHEEEFAPEGWYEESDSSEVIYQTSSQPTHWQPLPAPPATTEGQPDGR